MTITIANCNRTENSTNTQSSDYKILTTLYKNTNDTIFFIRILRYSEDIELQLGTICFDEAFNSVQTIDSVKAFDFEKINTDSLIKEFQHSEYREKFSSFREVMFIQIKPNEEYSDTSFFKFMRLRHKLESKIGRFLIVNQIGEQLAGDMGPGGANMLFFIDDWDLGIRGVLKILDEADLTENVIIARRLSISINNWNYEVVFPYDFEGLFISL